MFLLRMRDLVSRVSTVSADNIIYNGLLASAVGNEQIILHFHGMSGSIYSNLFYSDMIDVYPKNGIDFLICETRSTGGVTQFRTADGGVVVMGTAYDDLSASKSDLDAWIN